MAGETSLTIVGRLTADPELRYTQDGKAVANFTIASNARIFDRTANEWKDGDPLFLTGSIWRDYAENVVASLVKGSHVIVVGQLIQRSYETKPTDGSAPQKRTVHELRVEHIGPALQYARATVHKIMKQDSDAAPSASIPALSGAAAEAPF